MAGGSASASSRSPSRPSGSSRGLSTPPSNGPPAGEGSDPTGRRRSTAAGRGTTRSPEPAPASSRWKRGTGTGSRAAWRASSPPPREEEGTMRWLSNLLFRLRALLRSGREERELTEEVAFHLDMETRKLIGQGMAPEPAAREARLRFGGIAYQQESAREPWGIRVLRDALGDVRHAVRQLRRRPGFTFLAVATLALGLGATVALFSVVRGLLLRPLPVAREAGLQVFWSDWDGRGSEFDFVKERARVFSGLAAYTAEGLAYRTDAGSTVVLTGVPSAGLFDVIGARPLLGRTFAPGEDRPGAEPVVVLSWAMWRQELGGDPGVLGRRIILDGTPTTVIGVMPRSEEHTSELQSRGL